MATYGKRFSTSTFAEPDVLPFRRLGLSGCLSLAKTEFVQANESELLSLGRLEALDDFIRMQAAPALSMVF